MRGLAGVELHGPPADYEAVAKFAHGTERRTISVLTGRTIRQQLQQAEAAHRFAPAAKLGGPGAEDRGRRLLPRVRLPAVSGHNKARGRRSR